MRIVFAKRKNKGEDWRVGGGRGENGRRKNVQLALHYNAEPGCGAAVVAVGDDDATASIDGVATLFARSPGLVSDGALNRRRHHRASARET